MSDNQAFGFFTISFILTLGVVIGFGAQYLVRYVQEEYNARREREKKELEEARVMFEQRIALKPKHIGARHASGAAPVIFGEVDSNDGQE